ncbi:BN159_2729 family protein [Streptomyces sp. NPDC004065]|uniref:BN159_2729 family protein n=1 Tax=Streptomyces sp. NPDC004065 TaxID=3364689 RepID=UPI00384B471F
MTGPDPHGTGAGADAEQELTARLRELARAFIADLRAQGRLVENGGGTAGADVGGGVPGEPGASGDSGAFGRSGASGCSGAFGDAGNSGDAGTSGDALRPAPPSGVLDSSHPLHLLYTLGAPGLSADADADAEPVAQPAPDPEPAAPPARPATASDWPPAVTPSTLVPSALVPSALVPSALVPSALVPAPEAVRDAAAQDPEPGPAQPPTARTAARLRAEHAGRLEVTRITWDQERVTVRIHALSLADWDYWLTAVGAPLDAPTQRTAGAQTVTGQLDGVEIHLTAHDVPRLLEQAARRAAEPFCLAGRVYDLAQDHTDRHGRRWLYRGRSRDDETPLLVLAGTDGPSYPLTTVVTANGPLTPAPRHSTDD